MEGATGEMHTAENVIDGAQDKTGAHRMLLDTVERRKDWEKSSWTEWWRDRLSNLQIIRTTQKEHKINGDAIIRGREDKSFPPHLLILPQKGKQRAARLMCWNHWALSVPGTGERRTASHMGHPLCPATPPLGSILKIKRQIVTQQASSQRPKSQLEGALLGKWGQSEHEKEWL